MKEKIKSVLLLITITTLLVTRYMGYKSTSIFASVPVTRITDISMLLLIVLAVLKNNK